MGHFSLKIQSSALFLKAKNAFSLHRKSHSSSSPTDSTLSSPPLSTASTSTSSSSSGSPMVPTTESSSLSTSSSSSSSAGAGVAPQKRRRSSRFKVRSFPSFRDRSSSPPLTSSTLSSITTTLTGRCKSNNCGSGNISTANPVTTAISSVTNPVSPPVVPTGTVYSLNPYSSSWSPSTVARSPFRGVSLPKTVDHPNSSRSPKQAKQAKQHFERDLDRLSSSPAPNLILQPSPMVDLAPCYATGARLSISPTMLRHKKSDESVSQYQCPLVGPQAHAEAQAQANALAHVQTPPQQGRSVGGGTSTGTRAVSSVNPLDSAWTIRQWATPSSSEVTQTTAAAMGSPSLYSAPSTPQSLFVTQMGQVSLDPFLRRRFQPTYPSPEQRRLLIDQHFDIILHGPHIDFLSNLPYEIATYILHFVDMHNLAKVSLISRTWNQFARDNEVWKSVYLYQKQWTIHIPRRPSTTVSTLQESPGEGSQHSGGSQAHLDPSSSPQNHSLVPEIKPLNWKMLCYDRKRLEARWSEVPPKTKVQGHSDSVYCVQFDDQKIVTGSRDRTIKIWDLFTLKCTRTLEGHSQSVLCLQFNDRIMVSGSSDHSLIVWDMGTLTERMRLRGHSAGVLDVCFDDQYIVSCSKDTKIMVWDVKSGLLVRTMEGHTGPVNAVQLYKGHVVSASGDTLVKLWNVGTGQCIRDFEGHERGLACVQFDGETIVSGSNDKTIRVWDASTGKCLQVLRGHNDLVRTLHFDKNRIVSGSYDNTVKVWDMSTGKCTLDLHNGHVSWVFDVQFSATRIISTSQDKNIIVWDFSSGMDVRLFN